MDPDQLTRKRNGQLDAAVRRLMDIGIALAMLIFLAPLMVVVAACIFIDDPGPILFRQARLGLNGRTFKCLKFRSMRRDAQAQLSRLLAISPAARREWEIDHKLKNDPRVTGVGLFLRKSSLDELPQLWNVLVGEMSLVGPRPIVAEEVPRYGRHFRHYCRVRPGLTGLWQVSGRNNVSYGRRVVFDVAYARGQCSALNLKILIATVPAVLSRDGSY